MGTFESGGVERAVENLGGGNALGADDDLFRRERISRARRDAGHGCGRGSAVRALLGGAPPVI